jgi:hypothetical protein
MSTTLPLKRTFMSTSFARVALLLAAALAAGCTTQPQVRHDHDPSVDMQAYKTFAFYEADRPGAGSYTTLVEARLKETTRRQLEQYRLVYSDSNPDLRVNLMLQVVEKQELRPAPGARTPPVYRGWAGVESVDYRQGMLWIDLVDARSHKLVWRGVAEGRIGDTQMRDPGATIDEAVRAVFTGLPGDRSR